MEFERLKDILYIAGIIISGGVSFLATWHNLKEYFRDKMEAQTERIHEIELKLKDLEAKDNLQQHIIVELGKQVEENIALIVKKVDDGWS